ncbi:BnaC05g15050D [Brassica napus]|uniref:BnaC05g15050D protein n=1 Tax=Brassica napus TaxID=3708 RepID=A0A078HNC3_BRANA|nr:BnaC05g15050D [Brassica napus]
MRGLCSSNLYLFFSVLTITSKTSAPSSNNNC